MLIVISPAKNLDYETALPTKRHSKAGMLDDASLLMTQLKKLAPQDISLLMGISDKLGALNYDRYQTWAVPFTSANARPAALAFNGDVYSGLDAYNFSDADFLFAQQHLRILSGLYGLLRPLDLMQPYRLEMGTKFATDRGKDLYAFWGERLTLALSKQLKALDSDILVNLASNEYFKAIKPKDLGANIITPAFKDWKNGDYKIISFFAKKARGLMSAYIIKNGITEAGDIKSFDVGGYRFNNSLSSGNSWVFTRKQ